LQTTIGRSGNIKKRTEIRRESQRDVLRGLSRGTISPPPPTPLRFRLTLITRANVVLAKEGSVEGITRLNDIPRDEDSGSLSPPELQSRLSTPSSDDDLPPPRISLSHDPLGSSRRVTRTPPSTGRKSNDDTVQSIETIRRAPFNRLSDRLSFGAEDVDDTMMDILANRADTSGGGFADESLDFGAPPIEEYIPPVETY